MTNKTRKRRIGRFIRASRLIIPRCDSDGGTSLRQYNRYNAARDLLWSCHMSDDEWDALHKAIADGIRRKQCTH